MLCDGVAGTAGTGTVADVGVAGLGEGFCPPALVVAGSETYAVLVASNADTVCTAVAAAGLGSVVQLYILTRKGSSGQRSTISVSFSVSFS